MAAAATSRRGAVPLLRRWGGASREAILFRLAVLAIAVHVVDDNFLQPPRGTSAADHLASGLVPLAILGLAGWAYPRLRGPWRAAMAATLGVLGLAAGFEGAYRLVLAFSGASCQDGQGPITR